MTEPGSRNWMGMNSPAAEAMIARMLDSTGQEDFIAATQALDRILTAGRYVIPIWFSKVSRIAHSSSSRKSTSGVIGTERMSAPAMIAP